MVRCGLGVVVGGIVLLVDAVAGGDVDVCIIGGVGGVVDIDVVPLLVVAGRVSLVGDGDVVGARVVLSLLPLMLPMEMLVLVIVAVLRVLLLVSLWLVVLALLHVVHLLSFWMLVWGGDVVVVVGGGAIVVIVITNVSVVTFL